MPSFILTFKMKIALLLVLAIAPWVLFTQFYYESGTHLYWSGAWSISPETANHSRYITLGDSTSLALFDIQNPNDTFCLGVFAATPIEMYAQYRRATENGLRNKPVIIQLLRDRSAYTSMFWNHFVAENILNDDLLHEIKSLGERFPDDFYEKFAVSPKMFQLNIWLSRAFLLPDVIRSVYLQNLYAPYRTPPSRRHVREVLKVSRGCGVMTRATPWYSMNVDNVLKRKDNLKTNAIDAYFLDKLGALLENSGARVYYINFPIHPSVEKVMAAILKKQDEDFIAILRRHTPITEISLRDLVSENDYADNQHLLMSGTAKISTFLKKEIDSRER